MDLAVGGLHCLSAFCPSATDYTRMLANRKNAVSIAFRRSALRPLESSISCERSTSAVSIAFRRSALRPLVLYHQKDPALVPVSIAFRRSALRPHHMARKLSDEDQCLHCLSAFCPSATSVAAPSVRSVGGGGLHCLSAFCPSATGWLVIGVPLSIMSPLPFGVLPFGHGDSSFSVEVPDELSPLPFGVLPFGHSGFQTAWLTEAAGPSRSGPPR